MPIVPENKRKGLLDELDALTAKRDGKKKDEEKPRPKRDLDLDFLS